MVFTTDKRNWQDDMIISATVEDLSKMGYCVLVKFLGLSESTCGYDFDITYSKD